MSNMDLALSGKLKHPIQQTKRGDAANISVNAPLLPYFSPDFGARENGLVDLVSTGTVATPMKVEGGIVGLCVSLFEIMECLQCLISSHQHKNQKKKRLYMQAPAP